MSLSKRIFIYGAGAHGSVVLDILLESGISPVGWLDDDEILRGRERDGLPIVGGIASIQSQPSESVGIIVAVGNSSARLKMASRAMTLGATLVNAIHPSAIISRSAHMGSDVCVCAGVVIGAKSSIGDHVIINTSSSIDHDCRLEEGAWVAPGVCTGGGVRVGRCAFISTGAVLVAGVTIGDGAVVAAGATVTQNVSPHTLVMGVPARCRGSVRDRLNIRRLIDGVGGKNA